MGKSKPITEILAGWANYERPADGTRYRHYKGGEYEIVTTGFLEKEEVPAVVYRSLEKDIVWVRSAEDFFAIVQNGYHQQPRFESIPQKGK